MFDNWYDIEKRPTNQYAGIVPTAQIEWELLELVDIYQRYQPKVTLEIGSQYGGSLWFWMRNAPEGAKIISTDLGPDKWIPRSDFDQTVWDDWAKGVRIHRITGNSQSKQVYEEVLNLTNSIDFLFIDADHTYEGARADFEKYGPMVNQGGVIALHDLVTPEEKPHIQVWQVWREIQAAGYKTQELRAFGNFGGIGVVYV